MHCCHADAPASGYLMIESGVGKSMLELEGAAAHLPVVRTRSTRLHLRLARASAPPSSSVPPRPSSPSRAARASCSSSSASPSSSTIVSRCGEPLRRQTIASRRTAWLSSAVASRWQERPDGVDRPGCVAGEQLERDQRRAAAGRALVLEAAPQQLDLLAETELADRAVRDRPLAVVRRRAGAFDLVLPLACGARRAPAPSPPRRARRPARRPRRASRRDRIERPRTLGARRSARTGRNSRPVRFCSRMCADQPATREQANIAGVERRAGSRRRRARRPSRTRRSSRSRTLRLAPLELGERGLLERLGDLDLRRAELLRRRLRMRERGSSAR